MDSFDQAILNILQTNSRISSEKLGARVGLSPSACQRRLKKLKSSGVIDKEVAVLNRAKLGGFTTIIVDIQLEKGGEKTLDDLIRKLDQEPRVQQFYYTAGEVDFVVIIVVNDMGEYDQLSRLLFMSNANIKKFHAKVVISAQKLGLGLPL